MKLVKKKNDSDGRKSNANCNQIILDHFWHLSGSSEERRCRSVQIIVQNLTKQISNNQYNDLSYCLDRLIRGLTSSREFSRHGFCILLTELLQHFPEHTDVADVIKIAEKEFGHFKSDFDSELTIAWTLFISCLLKSKRITNDTDKEIITKLFENLFLIGCKKDYVEIIVCSLMNSFYEIFSDDKELFQEIVVDRLMKMDEHGNMLFKTYLILLCFQRFKLSKEYIVKNVYKSNSKDFTNIIKLIKETSKFQPNIHPIIELFTVLIKQIDGDNLDEYFAKLIEGIFKVDMVKTSLGFDIIPIMLDNVSHHSQIKTILSPTVIRLLIQTLSNKQHPLNKAALVLCNRLENYSLKIKDQTSLQIEFARCFIEKPGSINFDELSRSKLLFNILKNFSNDSIKEWISILMDLMIKQDNVVASDFYRVRCLQQITHLLKCYTGDDEFLMKNCKIFLVFTYFERFSEDLILDNDSGEKLKRFKYPISEKLRRQFKSSFQNVIVHLYAISSTVSTNSGSITFKNKLANQIEMLTQLKDFIMVLIKDKKLELVNKQISMKKFREVLLEINEKFDSIKTEENKCYVFRLFYLHFLIESFENLSDIQTILPDFNECFNRAFSDKNPKEKSSDPLWSDVLVDLLISLITKSKSTKNIILMTFKYLVPFISPIGIQSLNEAFVNDGTIEFEDEDMDDEEDDDDDDGDGEMETTDQIVDTDEDDDEDDDVLEDDTEPVDDEFKKNVLKALGSAAEHDDDGDDSDEVLSDSEMFKLDESLAQVFKQKYGEKKRQAEKASMIKSFKLRVLDLIKILIDHHPKLSVEIVFTILTNIFNFLKSNHSSKNMTALNNKCQQLLQQISKTNPVFIENEKIAKDDFENLLTVLLELQCKCKNMDLQKSFIALTSWLLSLSRNHLSENDLEFFHEHIERNLLNFFKRAHNEIKPEVFKTIIPQLYRENFFDSSFFEIINQFSSDDKVRPFKRCIALDILEGILKRISDDQKTESRLIEFGEKYQRELLETLKKSQQNEIKIINLYIQVLMVIDIFSLKTSENIKTDILQAINSLPKNFRRQINKQFVNKLKSIESN
ncbi:Myb-binding protein 1A [Dermatophagoides farinae]|uniref:Myb-binding protein 1A n=1 Tax=Dermatophagoides farinae TaxID=6954 RepID=A0A922IDJ6_DERFA|nr:Myb-binding protein 1A [Dermatophagoides farinae]